MIRKLLSSVAAIGLAIGFASAAAAAPIDLTFSGLFQKDNDIAKFTFSLTSSRSVTMFSSSWASGGFDPALFLFDSAGEVLARGDDGYRTGAQIVNGQSYGYGLWDSYLAADLAAGTYTVAIAQATNSLNGTNIAAGFVFDGNPDFTYEFGYGGATQPYFNGLWSSRDPRNGHWTVHVLNIADADNVPEPAALAVLGAGLIGLGIARRRRKAA